MIPTLGLSPHVVVDFIIISGLWVGVNKKQWKCCRYWPMTSINCAHVLSCPGYFCCELRKRQINSQPGQNQRTVANLCMTPKYILYCWWLTLTQIPTRFTRNKDRVETHDSWFQCVPSVWMCLYSTMFSKVTVKLTFDTSTWRFLPIYCCCWGLELVLFLGVHWFASDLTDATTQRREISSSSSSSPQWAKCGQCHCQWTH